MGSKTNFRQRDGDGRVLWHVRPDEVDDDGMWAFGPTGYLTAVVGQRLMPPDTNDDDDKVMVIAQQDAVKLFKTCPSCKAKVQKGRQAFSGGEFILYPCTACDEWVWTWAEDGSVVEC